MTIEELRALQKNIDAAIKDAEQLRKEIEVCINNLKVNKKVNPNLLLKDAIGIIKTNHPQGFFRTECFPDGISMQDFVKRLEKLYVTDWEPSSEHMDALRKILIMRPTDTTSIALKSLYDELKKF